MVLQLGLAVEGHPAGATGGSDLDPLVNDHDVVPQALFRQLTNVQHVNDSISNYF